LAADAFILVGRNDERLKTIACDLAARGASSVATLVSDLSDPSSCEERFQEFCATPLGWPDQVLLAYGALGDQGEAEVDSDAARRMIGINFTSAALWLLMAVKHVPRDRERALVVLGSVAGDRGRRSNYIYGAAKAGLATFAEGLAHRLHGTPLQVVLVKPGFVDTPMTAHLDRSGLLWSKPDAIAAVIDRAVSRKQTVAYAPRFWAIIMTVIRLLPRSIFFRSKL
jgi:short-subunit dehydrogenase